MAVKKKNDIIEQNTNDIIDIDLSATKKQRFRINGDDNSILELNTSDAGMLARLDEAQERMNGIIDKMSNLSAKTDSIDEENVTNEDVTKLGDIINDMDKDMRSIIDYVFDSNVSEICAPQGTMFDPIGGRFRYEHIIDKISDLYEQNIKAESKKMQARLRKHTGKYNKIMRW